jgi:hypothetical protein
MSIGSIVFPQEKQTDLPLLHLPVPPLSKKTFRKLPTMAPKIKTGIDKKSIYILSQNTKPFKRLKL